MTASIAELRQHFEHENQLWKSGDHYRQGRVRDAYNAWFKASVRAGNPPDALVRKIEDETERFLDRVIAGVDGHSYWDAGERFYRNDGGSCYPRTWWYIHYRGLIEMRSVIKPVCGDPHCIAPEHQEISPWGEHRQHYTDQQCHGALQVASMRLGRSPSRNEYEALGLVPSSGALVRRFSSWNRALASSGLPPSGVIGGQAVRQYSKQDCIDKLQAVKAELGYVPNSKVWKEMRLYPSEHTIRRRFGGWLVALQEAGVR